MLQEPAISQDLTVGELLEMQARWYSRSLPIDDVIALVELEASRDTRAGTLSGGQRRRLDLALALVGDPDVLFLDEPTTGFDPHARRQAWTTIRSLCDLGKTVVLTTHYMDEAQHLADRVAVMVAGEIVASGPPESLAGRDEQPTEIRFVLPAGVALADLPRLPGRVDRGGRRRRPDHDADGVAAIHAAQRAGRSSATCRSRGCRSRSRPSRTSTWPSPPASPRRPCDDTRIPAPARPRADRLAGALRAARFWRNRRARSSASPSR